MARPLTTRNLLTLVLILVVGTLSVLALLSYRKWEPESTFESIPENIDLTLRKISDKFEYDKYLKDEILSEVIRKLKKELSEEDSEGYIKNYEDYMKGVLRYERGIKKNAVKEFEGKISEAKAREEEAKAREEEAKAKAEKERQEKEKAKAREEEAKTQLHNAIIQLHKNGQSEEQIAQLFGLSVEEVQSIIEQVIC